MNIDVIKSEGLVFDKSEMALQELPPIPQWFQDQVNEVGGFFDDDITKPNVRVVSGLDPNIIEFYGGGWHRKYVRRETHTFEYYIAHTKKGEKKILSPAEAKVFPKSMGIVMPVVDKKITEYGIPRYFVELYKPPYAFGDRESWESVRYLDKDEPTNLAGVTLDMLGEFPEQGGYDTWFCIEEPIMRDGKAVATKFRPLDEDVLIFIRYMVDKIKKESAEQQHLQVIEQRKKDWQKMISGIREDVKDIVKDRIDRLTETPKIFVPELNKGK